MYVGCLNLMFIFVSFLNVVDIFKSKVQMINKMTVMTCEVVTFTMEGNVDLSCKIIIIFSLIWTGNPEFDWIDCPKRHNFDPAHQYQHETFSLIYYTPPESFLRCCYNNILLLIGTILFHVKNIEIRRCNFKYAIYYLLILNKMGVGGQIMLYWIGFMQIIVHINSQNNGWLYGTPEMFHQNVYQR